MQSNPVYYSRRHDVDWLRVLAFISLIFYHIGMFYVHDWGWHVKSTYQSVFLQNIMLMFNQWRMPLIFFISGLALAMVEPKIGSFALMKIRFVRIFVPLIIGMALIVPPQTYLEAIQNYAYAGNYLSFWLEYIDPATQLLPAMHHEPVGLLTWNHLWYLMYLWVYTLVYIVFKPFLQWVANIIRRQSCGLFTVWLAPVLILTVYVVFLRPYYPKTNALFGDWFNHALYFTVFILGYFVAKSPAIWHFIIDSRRKWAGLAVVGFTGIMAARNGWISIPENDPIVDLQNKIWLAANLWSWLLMVVGFGGAYLNKPSTVLTYLNEAILPWYILHQTIIIIIATTLSKFALGGSVESGLLIISTFAACAILYEAIRRFKPLRFAFGMKLN